MAQKRSASELHLPPKKRKKSSTSSFGSRFVSSLLSSSSKSSQKPKANYTRTLRRPAVSVPARKNFVYAKAPSAGNHTRRIITNLAPSKKDSCEICFQGFSPHIRLGNRSLRCSFCGIVVHPSCYGSNHNSLGPWFCDKCQAGCHGLPKCEICGLKAFGAFKKVEGGGFAHLICAMWVPNTDVKNTQTMSPVIGVKDIIEKRKSLKCVYCGLIGVCIQCHHHSCNTSFHVLCAKKYDPKLLVTVSVQRKQLFAFCKKHHPRRPWIFRNLGKKPQGTVTDEENYRSRKASQQVFVRASKQIRCTKCGKPFKSEGTLRRHVKHCNATHFLSKFRGSGWGLCAISSSPSEEKSLPIQCPWCPLKVFAGSAARDAMFDHIHAVHYSNFFQKALSFQPGICLRYLIRRNIGVQHILDLVDRRADEIMKSEVIENGKDAAMPSTSACKDNVPQEQLDKSTCDVEFDSEETESD